MAQQPAALAVGRVDAGIVAEPYLTNALDTCTLLSKLGDEVARTYLIGAYFATLAYAQAHRAHVCQYEHQDWTLGKYAYGCSADHSPKILEDEAGSRDGERRVPRPARPRVRAAAD
jgi:hypothetical protein